MTTMTNDRYKADLRQFGGLLFALSIPVSYFPMTFCTAVINRDGGTATSGVELSMLVGYLCAMALGLTGMTTGYLLVVHDYGHQLLTSLLLCVEQLAFIIYITEMVNIYKIITADEYVPSLAVFIPPPAYGEITTPEHVTFIGAMGILGIFAICFAFFGSLGFLGFCIYTYQVGHPEHRPASYYRGRQVFYCLMLSIAGLANLMLGVYIYQNFGKGPLPAPIASAMFVVHFPELNMATGALWIANGLFGMARGFGIADAHNPAFQFTCFVQYVLTVYAMIFTQTAFAPADALSFAPATISLLTLGLHVMPAFLDYKGRSTPEEFPKDYFYQSAQPLQETAPLKGMPGSPAERTQPEQWRDEERDDVRQRAGATPDIQTIAEINV